MKHQSIRIAITLTGKLVTDNFMEKGQVYF